MLSWTWSRRPSPRPALPSPRISIELLEDRLVPSITAVYVESNNPDLGENAVLAFRRDAGDGSLTPIGTYATGGTGQLNLPKVLGPEDSDQEVIATPDGQFLFAVNQGSNSITSFRIASTGELQRIATFDSGGVQPVSLGIAGDRLYVVNRGDVTATQEGTVAPNLTGFDINADGSLTPLPDATITFPVGTSPAQALISRTGRFLFADIFGIPGSSVPQGNTLAPFLIQPDGTLEHAAGEDARAPADPPLLLGTASHPTLNILYAGFTGAQEVGVFTYDETGRTSFVDAVPDQGRGACWCVVSADGRYLYVTTTGSDSIGVFALDDPLHPVQIQELTLNHVPNDANETADFQLALDPSGQSLYVVNQSTNPTGTNHRGNQLHMLTIAGDGTVSEPSGPLVFSPADVPANAHPQGVAAVLTADSTGAGALPGIIQSVGSRQGSPLPLTGSPFLAEPPLRHGSPEPRSLVLHATAGTTDRLVPETTTANEGTVRARPPLSHTDVSGLDAFFESEPFRARRLSGSQNG